MQLMVKRHSLIFAFQNAIHKCIFSQTTTKSSLSIFTYLVNLLGRVIYNISYIYYKWIIDINALKQNTGRQTLGEQHFFEVMHQLES